MTIDAPLPSDYDAYGIRFTANDFLIVEAQNRDQDVSIFAIQFYNLLPRLSCAIELNDSAMYIYSVSIGKNQSINQQYFAFNGYKHQANVSMDIAFIGMVQNKVLNKCNFTITYTVINSKYDIGDYYVMTVDPQGLMAYGFAFKFCVLYNLQTQMEVDWNLRFYDYSYNSYNTSISTARRFMPHAIAATNNYIILVGVTHNQTLDRWMPTAYLIDVRNCSQNVNSTCILPWLMWPQWRYDSTLSSWEMYSADDENNDYYDSYEPLYTLSVDINPSTNQILFGIQYFSTVVRLLADAVHFSNLSYIDQRTTGTAVGFGKSVKYAADGSITILVNNYSYDYQTWYSSSIQTYNYNSNFNDKNSLPVFTFPNIHQPLWTPSIDPTFLAIHVTSVALMFIDVKGNVYALANSPPGYYTDSSSGTGQNQIYFSITLPCERGRYKTDTDLDWCHMCPQGLYNSGNMTLQCVPCSNATSFCPLGSVSDTAISFTSRQTQIRAYPESPDNIIFDDILILNMFSLSTTDRRCLLISPLFWTLIILGIAISIIVIMGLLKLSIRCQRIRRVLKIILRLTDLIGEGEFWIGGLASFAILVLCIFAYTFSNSYLNQYPIESVGESLFACDRSLSNAKFSSSLQLLAAADTSAEGQQQMFDLMNEQTFTLHVSFVNSLFQCNKLRILETISFRTSYLLFQCSFDTNNSVMSVDVNLTTQFSTIQFVISSSMTAGGLSIGLTGPEISSSDAHYIVRELTFQEPFSVDNQTLTQSPEFEIQLIKVLNITKSLQSSSDDEKYSSLYIPSFSYDSNQVFYNEDNFNRYHTASETTLTLKITNSLYYIRNIQEPIARQAEILFHNLLFTIVCIEIFGLVFLVFKLIVMPLWNFVQNKMTRTSNRIEINDDDEDETEMKKRVFNYFRKLEAKEQNNVTETDLTARPVTISYNEAQSLQCPISIIEPTTNAMQFSPLQQSNY